MVKRCVWALVVGGMFWGAVPALAARSFDAGEPDGDPVFAADGVVWATSDDQTHARVLFRRWGGPTRQIARFRGTFADDYGSVRHIFGLSADGDKLAWTVVTDEGVPGRYDGTDPGSGGTVYRATTRRRGRVAVLTCPYGLPPQVALGLGFEVLLNPCPDRMPDAGEAAVSIDGRVVGQGTRIAAAGRYAAWESATPDPVVSVYDTGSSSVVSQVPAQAGWTLSDDGTVVTRDLGTVLGQPQPPIALTATTRDGHSGVLLTETASILGLAMAGGTVAYVASDGSESDVRVVVQRGGQRHEVARLYAWWLGGYGVATDGQRVAWTSARCRDNRITVAKIGERRVEQRVASCPVQLGRSGGFDPRSGTITVPMRCKIGVPPGDGCRAMTRVYHHGHLIAHGIASEPFEYGENQIPLTASSEQFVRSRRRFRASVVATRLGTGVRRTAQRTVDFSNERR
jgi:hypothetical protein